LRLSNITLPLSRLSVHLYSSYYSFIYELVQNSDDNNYSIALKANDLPALTFRLSNDRIVIDSNEDGFSEDNVRAICGVGKTTKVRTRGYVGEKGIGFKSVFKVARKVHIQSEPYSFAFEYDPSQHENGLGMITPLMEEYRNLSQDVRTRIILYLQGQCDREVLFRQFEDLPDTLLLFLQQLKKLTIQIERDGKNTIIKQYTLTLSGNRAYLSKIVGTQSFTLNVWVARRAVTNIAEEVSRETKYRNGISEAEVVLGFPLDRDDIPIVQHQCVFAFLPLRMVGFKVCQL
jgi:hypothetical protein